MSHPSRPIVDADLHAFVDGQMDFERRAVMVQAMAADPELRARVEQWRRQNELITATFGGVLREPVPLRLMPTSLSRTRAAPANLSPKPSSQPLASAPFSSIRITAIAIAAFVAGGAMVFIVDALSFGPTLPGESRVTELAAPASTRSLALRAYEAHRTFATDLVHPVEVAASDEPHLLTWLQNRLAMRIRIPDLKRQGWTLVGGRVVPGELGPAAFLVYGNGVERIGLYMARSNARQAEEFSVYDNGMGLGSVGYWLDEPLGFALTTNRDAAWLDRDGAALYQTIRTQAHDNASAD